MNFTSQPLNLLTIILMALVTYSTRTGGYLLLRHYQPSPRIAALMRAAPGCVLISVIAPGFVSPHPADLLALGCTILAALHLPMLATVITAILSAGLFRHFLPS